MTGRVTVGQSVVDLLYFAAIDLNVRQILTLEVEEDLARNVDLEGVSVVFRCKTCQLLMVFNRLRRFAFLNSGSLRGCYDRADLLRLQKLTAKVFHIIHSSAFEAGDVLQWSLLEEVSELLLLELVIFDVDSPLKPVGMRHSRNRVADFLEGCRNVQSLVFDHLFAQEVCETLGGGNTGGFLVAVLLQRLGHASVLRNKLHQLFVCQCCTLAVQHIQPAVSDLCDSSITVSQCFSLEEKLENLLLEDLDELQLTATLHLETLQLSQTAIVVEDSVSFLQILVFLL
ncbi:hypothetical protein HG531_006427 [Fusarium graminearum]|nr:hypothetical protein HG531_006427 [Fusarium graminearum]